MFLTISDFDEVIYMKKYEPRANKWLACFTAISAVSLIIGIILFVTDAPSFELNLMFTMVGFMLSIVFSTAYVASKTRWMTIDDEKIVFHLSISVNGKSVSKKTVRFNEIASVHSEFRKGDLVFVGDCFIHTMKLNDGSEIEFFLYEYGRETEQEIVKTIKDRT